VVEQEHKLEGLQAARAIAALAVAYFHSYAAIRSAFPESAWLPIAPLKDWGYLGVNFFFAISGYVICLVVSKTSFTLRSFVIKRLFRLYPMYWVAMAIVLGLIGLGKYPAQPVGHFLYSMTLLPQHGAPAYDVSWTLEREMVFYALAAAIVPFGGVRALALTLAGLAVLGWQLGNPWSFHLVSTTQADFLAGVLVFLGSGVFRNIGSAVPIATGLVLLTYTRSHDFPFATPICMAIALVGMVNLRLPWHRQPFRLLVLAGDASYSIYLLHYIVFLIAAMASVRLGFTLPTWVCEPFRFAAIAACCLISYLTWRVIERPMIRLGDQLSRTRSVKVQPA